MDIESHVSADDKARVKALVEKQGKTKIVRDRYDRNLAASKPEITKNRLWRAMVCMRLTTRASSGPNSNLAKFQSMSPFPLTVCEMHKQQSIENFIYETFAAYKVGTDRSKASAQLSKNFNQLENEGWLPTLNQCNRLLRPSLRETETEVATYIEKRFDGFGPKQSRNVLQALGLTRYEIPIDSRVANWLNKVLQFPFHVSAAALADRHYYRVILDAVCRLCEECEIAPCVLDAAIFSANDDDTWSVEELRY